MYGLKMKIMVAVCENMGIGINNTIPWKLRSEMKYFQKMTTHRNDSSRQNAVIMGRKTWLSIPQKHRPLKSRINIVLSRQELEGSSNFEGVSYIAKSLDDAVDYLKTISKQNPVESVWIIGGAEVYQNAMKSRDCEYIYLTRILSHFNCDTFFPPIPENTFKLIQDPLVPDTMQSEGDIKFKYEVYKRE